jgi:hypothetical protein
MVTKSSGVSVIQESEVAAAGASVAVGSGGTARPISS